MFVYDPTKNFNISKVPHSIGIEGDVSTPTASYALPWVQNQKNFVAAGMQGLGQLDGIAKLVLGVGAGLLVLKLLVTKRHFTRKRQYRKALKRALA